MILHEVRVKNVRSYESGKLLLSAGTTALAGDIGSGKSSLLQAMEMSLFGFAEVDATNLLRHGCNEGEVEVVFEDEGSLLSLKRSIKRRFSAGKEASPVQTCSIARDGHRSSYSVTEMKSEVIKLLGFPDDPNPRSHSDLWRWAVYVPQERMREVLSQNDDERLETVRRAHGLEEYRTSRDNAQEVARELKRIEERLRDEARIRGEASRTLDESASRLKEAEPRLAALRKASAEFHHALEDAETRREELRKTLRELEAVRERSRELSSRLTEIGSKADHANRKKSEDIAKASEMRVKSTEMEEQLETITISPESITMHSRALDELRVQREAAQKAREELLSTREALKSAKSSLENTETRLSRARTNLSAREDAVKRLKKEVGTSPPQPPTADSLQDIDDRQRAIRSELSETDSELGASRHSEKEIADLVGSGTCPRCKQTVDPVAFGAHLKEARDKTSKLESKKAELDVTLRALDKQREERNRYERDLLKWQEGKKRLDLATEEAAVAGREVDSLSADREERAVELVKAQTRVVELGPEEERYEKACKAERDAREALDALRKEDQKKREVEHTLRTLKETIKGVEALIAQHDEVLATLDGDKVNVEKEIEEAGKRIALLEAEEKTYAGTEEHFTKVKEGLDAKSKELAVLENDMRHLSDEIKKAEESMRKGREAEVRAGVCRSMTDWLNLFTTAMEEVEKRRLQSIHRDFAKEFSKYFAILVEDGSMRTTLDATFTPYVTIAGVPTPPEALSGGERTALALAYRLSLGHTVRAARKLRLESLILDEPTEGFSEGQVTKLSELLRELGHRQILLVSHDSGLTGIADHVVRVEKVDGKSSLR
jgi:exonuclease SbcC